MILSIFQTVPKIASKLTSPVQVWGIQQNDTYLQRKWHAFAIFIRQVI